MPDESLLRVEYVPGDLCLEIGSFERYLRGFAGEEIGHEQLAVRVRSDVESVLVPVLLSVSDRFVRGTTTLEVSC